MKETRTVEVYICDACGREVQSDNSFEGEPAWGYHGQVMEIGSFGGNGGEFFACRKSCIKTAVVNAIWKDD